MIFEIGTKKMVGGGWMWKMRAFSSEQTIEVVCRNLLLFNLLQIKNPF